MPFTSSFFIRRCRADPTKEASWTLSGWNDCDCEAHTMNRTVICQRGEFFVLDPECCFGHKAGHGIHCPTALVDLVSGAMCDTHTKMSNCITFILARLSILGSSCALCLLRALCPSCAAVTPPVLLQGALWRPCCSTATSSVLLVVRISTTSMMHW